MFTRSRAQICALFLCLLTCLCALPAHAQMTIKAGSTSRKICFVMYATGTNTPTSGLTVSATVSKNGAAFGAGGGTVAEVGNGVYSYTPSAGDTTGVTGSFLVRATATGADPTIKEVNVVAFDPDDAAALGLSRLDAAVSTRLATSGYTAPSNPTDYARNNVSPTWYTAPTNPTDYARNNVAPSWWMLPSTYPLSVADEATLAGLHAMLTAYDNTAKFTSGALSNAPSASDPFGLTKGSYGAGTWGAFLNAQLDAAVSSRMATFGLPANFSSLLISNGGGVTVGGYASGQDPATLIKGMQINGRTFAQLCAILGFNPAGTIQSITKSNSAPWTMTIVYNDGSATATYVSTFSDNTFTVQTGRPTVTFTGLP